MLIRLLTGVLILSFLGCDSKEFKKSVNQNVDIVTDLNQGKEEAVIERLSARSALSPREKYYLASAYSRSANIDVLSLYPVLELQLFRKSALEWTDLSKEKNPYLKFMKSQEGINLEKRQEHREARWEKFLPRLIEKYNWIVNKPTLDDINNKNSYFDSVTEEEYALLDQKLEADYKAFFESGNQENWYDFANNSSYYPLPAGLQTLIYYYQGKVEMEHIKQKYLHPELQNKAFGNVAWEMVYMNILWNTYEAIPMLKQMPLLSKTQQGKVTQALEVYRGLLTDPEFKDVSLKNITVLIGTSLLSIYKESFALEEVNSIQDLMCTFEPQAILDNYPLIRNRLLFIAEASKDIIKNDEADKYREQAEAYKEHFPEELSQEERDSFLRSNEDFKVNSCFTH